MSDQLLAALDVATNYLRSIDATLKRMEARRGTTAGASAPAGEEVATDADLDGQYGDPEVKFDPKSWKGEPMIGRRLSDTSPEYLDAVASFADWMAPKLDAEGDTKKAGYKRKDAARARGWAKRLRAGWRRPGADDDNSNGPSW